MRRITGAVAVLAVVALAGAAAGQTTQQSFDPATGRALLSDMHDGTFSFDEPAFYWFARKVKFADPASVFEIGPDPAVVPWKFLLERPSDYRGQLVVVEGSLGRKYAWTSQDQGRELGEVYQAELFDPRSRGFCTVVSIEPLEDLPIQAWVRCKGYFLKVRQYQAANGSAGYAPLVVARRLAAVQQPASITESVGWSKTRWGVPAWGITLLAVLVAGWWVLRRRARSMPLPQVMQRRRLAQDEDTDLPDEVPPPDNS